MTRLVTMTAVLLFAAPASAEALLLLRGKNDVSTARFPSMQSCKNASDYMRKNKDRKRWEGSFYGNFAWQCVPISETPISEQPWD